MDVSNYHKIPIRELFLKLNTSPKGISDFEAKIRLKKYGLNKFSEPPKKSNLVKFLLQFKNFFSILLIIGSLLSFIGEYLSPGQGSIYVAWALLIVTIINAAFTFIQEYKAEKAMEAFKNLLPQKISVIRNGVEKEIESQYIAVGDIIVLNEGDKVPADARVIEEYLLKVDHSALTGESEPQLRTTKATHNNMMKSRNMLFSGTLIQSGTGKAVVIATGDNTKMGSLAKITENVKPESSKIKKELHHFIRIISTIALFLGVLFFGLGFLIGNKFMTNLVFAIGIIVANVPEGLLPTVTLTLSLAAKRMAKDKALVRDMESIETLGSVTTICTDKTGTLTQNKISVDKVFINNKLFSLERIHLKDEKGNKYKPHQIKGFQNLLYVMALCNNANHIKKEHRSIGDPTETALLDFVEVFEEIHDLRFEFPRKNEIPFDSDKKYMITANKIGNKTYAFLKGAPEKVFDKCTHIYDNGRYKKLTPYMKKSLLLKNKQLASQGLRVLAFAFKRSTINESIMEKNDYAYIAMVTMSDPPRPEVAHAVKLCKSAGIRIIVISGDQEETVKAIAKQVGIVRNPKIITGDMLSSMSDYRLKKELKSKEIIFARTLPMDKLRIVHNLQQLNEIVAVTGDGVNDAPALKKADVGVAMGSGTEVAREASDIVLLDDNFSTIVSAVKEGRTIYDNIKSFIVYILTSNTPEIIPFLFFVMFNWPLALPALLILSIDLGTDMLPAISLGVEKPEKDIMKKKPRDPNSNLVNWKVFARSYGFIGAFQTFFAYIMFFKVLHDYGYGFGSTIPITSVAYTSAVGAFFATIIITQVFNLIATRTLRTSSFTKPFDNKTMFFGILAELALLLLIVLSPVMNKVFLTHPFDLSLVWYMIAFGIIILFLEEARKFFYRKYGWFDIS